MEVSQVEFELQTFGMYARTYARTCCVRTVHGGTFRGLYIRYIRRQSTIDAVAESGKCSSFGCC